jgi:hypothetical protein
LLFSLFSAAGIYQAYHYTESVEFCGLTCHRLCSRNLRHIRTPRTPGSDVSTAYRPRCRLVRQVEISGSPAPKELADAEKRTPWTAWTTTTGRATTSGRRIMRSTLNCLPAGSTGTFRISRRRPWRP